MTTKTLTCEGCRQADGTVYPEHWYNFSTDREEIRHICDDCRTWLKEDAAEWRKYYLEVLHDMERNFI
jgi:hypothetical protein